MKKIMCLLLSVLMLLSFAACGGNDQGGNNNGNGNSNEIVISEDQLAECIEVIELNESNWKNYFEIETVTITNKNDFGEVISTESFYPLRIKTTGVFAYAFYNIAESNWSEFMRIDCTDTVTTYDTFFVPGTDGYEMIDCRERAIKIDEFSFIRSSCKLVLFNVPETYWNTDAQGQKYICYDNVKIFKDQRVEASEILSTVNI